MANFLTFDLLIPCIAYALLAVSITNILLVIRSVFYHLWLCMGWGGDRSEVAQGSKIYGNHLIIGGNSHRRQLASTVITLFKKSIKNHQNIGGYLYNLAPT